VIIRFTGTLGSIQSAESGNVSIIVSHEDNNVLVDVSGSPVQNLALAGISPLSLDLVVITHSHVDHTYALPSLVHNLWLLGRSNALRIVGNSETLQVAKDLCDVFGLEKKKGMFPIYWIGTDSQWDTIHCQSLDIDLFRVQHGVPTCGCRFISGDKTVVYMADCCPAETYPEELYGASVLIHEAGGTAIDEPGLVSRGHSSGRQAAMVARSLGCESLMLCHLPPDEQCQQMILSEAREVFPNTLIPKLFHPYEV